jgi:hypothetical protein
VLESLASTIISRIDDVIYADDLVRMSTLPLVVHQPSAKKAATQVLVDLLSAQKLKAEVKQQKEPEDLLKIPPDAITTTHIWSYAGKLENSNALHSPPSRD